MGSGRGGVMGRRLPWYQTQMAKYRAAHILGPTQPHLMPHQLMQQGKILQGHPVAGRAGPIPYQLAGEALTVERQPTLITTPQRLVLPPHLLRLHYLHLVAGNKE